jgi:hypothetical protein
MKKKTVFLPLWTDEMEARVVRHTQAAIIELFKKSQRLPVVSQLMKDREWMRDVPPNSFDFGNFYRM